jgi:DMSO/TMAO reductase YedYZ molybdopterin-dependent catalytic subunit
MPFSGRIFLNTALAAALLLFLCISIARAEEPGRIILKIGGMVKNPLSFTMADLADLPQITRCNPHDPEDNKNTMQGISVWQLLSLAGPKKQADSVIFFAPDGNTGGMPLPLEYLSQSDAMLVLRKNQTHIPPAQGLPFLPPSQVKMGYKWTDHVVSRILVTDISGITGVKSPAW